MLNFLKKEKAVETPLATPIFESDKEVQFKDPKTGEYIYQRPLTADQRRDIMAAMQRNAQAAQAFLQASRQVLMLEEKQIAESKAIVASEKEINDIINRIRDDLKLDRRWGFNMQLQVLERRDPPGE